MKTTRITRVLMLVGIMFSISVAGFMIIERWPLAESVYLVICTMTTVGYGDVVPLTPAGRWFSLLVMVGGVGVGFYSLSFMAATLVEGRLERLLGERRMRKSIEELSNHFVICGYGRVGKGLAFELSKMGAQFLVVERDPDRARLAEEDGWLVVQGEATEESVLQQAKIEKARGLATLLSDDAENLYITVSTRAIHPDLPIIARASGARGGRYLTQVGATGVIRLDQLGAARIARSLLRPDVVMFLEEMIGLEREDTQLDSLRLPPGTSLADHALSDLDLRGKYSLQILAIKRRGRYLANPGPSETLSAGDILVVVGPPKGIASLADVLEAEARPSQK